MRIDELISGLPLQLVAGDPSTMVADLTDDSRQVRAGGAFVARVGTASDGGRFIEDAITKGASVIISAQPPSAEQAARVAWVRGETVDQVIAGELAARFFGRPGGALKLIGITGTNGKTTVGLMTQHLLGSVGIKAGLIGTVFIDDGAGRRPAELTTPGAIDFSRALAAMVANGCKAAITEVSSHALDQGRTATLQFHAGVFTNLTGDHLDYHGDMDQYAAAKAKLFESLLKKSWAVVNADDAFAERMISDCHARVLRCTMATDASNDDPANRCVATVKELTPTASRARFDGPWGSVDATLPMVGRHNVFNALQAIAAAATVVDFKRGDLRRALATCPAAPGRLEPVGPDWPSESRASEDEALHADTLGLPHVLVDYAHTHDALENVLASLRPITPGRLIVVFGCGGDRDRTKRPLMAAVACEYGDAVIITSDNPRTEDPAAIIDDLVKGVPADAMSKCSTEINRAAAIAGAIETAEADDTVLIAGKGHEDYQILGTEKIHFDDREQAARALRALASNQVN